MENKNLDAQLLEEKSFNETIANLQVSSIYDSLKKKNNSNGPFEIEGDYAKNLCNLFEEKYGQKLNYNIENNLCYFSFEK